MDNRVKLGRLDDVHMEQGDDNKSRSGLSYVHVYSEDEKSDSPCRERLWRQKKKQGHEKERKKVIRRHAETEISVTYSES